MTKYLSLYLLWSIYYIIRKRKKKESFSLRDMNNYLGDTQRWYKGHLFNHNGHTSWTLSHRVTQQDVVGD